jgi:hypothetical protein
MGRRKVQKRGDFKGTRRQWGKRVTKQEGGSLKAKAKKYLEKVQNVVGKNMMKYGKKLKVKQKGGIISPPFRGYGPFPSRRFMYYQ